jgi:hypothetical protein
MKTFTHGVEEWTRGMVGVGIGDGRALMLIA